MSSGRGAHPRAFGAASAVQRLAVLLDAGLAPSAAWEAVAAAPGAPSLLREVRGRSAHELPSALRRVVRDRAPRRRERPSEPGGGDDWLAVAAALEVAGEAGAPLAPTLARLAGVLRDRAQSARDVETSLAGPVATARIVVLLPLVGLALGALIGVDALGTLVATPPGWVCLAVGLGGLGIAFAWTRRLVAAARRAPPDRGLELELLAVALSGGLGIDGATALVSRALAGRRVVAAAPSEEAVEVLAFARAAGVPAAALLRAEAAESRREAAAAAQRRAVVLGVRLLVPLGVCVLPAFLALGIVPILLSMIGATVGVL